MDHTCKIKPHLVTSDFTPGSSSHPVAPNHTQLQPQERQRQPARTPRLMRQEESGSSLFLCSNMVYPRMRNAILYFLIMLGCTWTVLHVWFWGAGRACADCPQGAHAQSSSQISGIRSVMREMFAGGGLDPGMPNVGSWCRNRSRQLDHVMVNLTGPQVKADDPELLTVLRRHIIDPPSPNLIKMSYPLFKTPQAEAVEKLTKGKRGGFFVECGALDGERSSNTIYLEQKRGWSGLLIEMDPSWYQQVRGKNRKSFSINACISPYQYPIKMDFKEHMMGQGKLLVNKDAGSSKPNTGQIVHKVYCFPFYSMMLSLNQTHIDYFSLDVEGLELDILRTIPFDKLDISIFTVEYVHGKGGEAAYTDYMATKGYSVHSRIKFFKPEIYFGANDLVFVKNTFKA